MISNKLTKKEVLPNIKDLYWVVYVQETLGMDRVIRRNWRASTPTIVGIGFEQTRLEEKILNQQFLTQEEFEMVLKKEKIMDKGVISSSDYKSRLLEITTNECWADFYQWKDAREIPNEQIIICNDYEEYAHQCRTLRNDIIRGKKFGQFPFNALTNYKLWG